MNDEVLAYGHQMTNGGGMRDAGFLRDGMVMPQSAGYAGSVPDGTSCRIRLRQGFGATGGGTGVDGGK